MQPNDISKIGRWFPQPTFNSDEDETITDINHHIEQNSLPLFEKDQTGELKNSVTRYIVVIIRLVCHSWWFIFRSKFLVKCLN